MHPTLGAACREYPGLCFVLSEVLRVHDQHWGASRSLYHEGQWAAHHNPLVLGSGDSPQFHSMGPHVSSFLVPSRHFFPFVFLPQTGHEISEAVCFSRPSEHSMLAFFPVFLGTMDEWGGNISSVLSPPWKAPETPSTRHIDTCAVPTHQISSSLQRGFR